MARVHALIVFAALGICPRQGWADPDIGSRIGQSPPAEIDENGRDRKAVTRHVVLDYGKCLLHYSRPAVDAFLTTVPGTAAYVKKGLSMSVSECLRYGEIRFPLPLLRGALYTALYGEQYGRIAPGDLAKAPEPAWWSIDPGASSASSSLALAQFGACVARADPFDAHKLTLSIAGTSIEGEALAALVPALGKCLPAGSQFKFSKDIVRGTVAEGLYRLRGATFAVPAPSAGHGANGGSAPAG